jgi:rhodanese-related sulfurtransferase
MDIQTVDVSKLPEILEAGGMLVDVRHDHEYEDGHVPGAVLIPLPDLPDRVSELPTDREFYVMCRTAGRSGRAVEWLVEQGFDARLVEGGIIAWYDSGQPVAEGPEPG